MKPFVLVNIPSRENAYHSFQDFAAICPPIGLATIAAVLEDQGYEVIIIDGDAENLSLEDAVTRTVAWAPDFVGSTTMTATMDITGRFYSLLKRELPTTTVIVGGPHVSAIPAQTIERYEDIDIVVIGEGDETVAEVMSCIRDRGDISAVRGIAFRKNGRAVKTESRPPVRDLSKTLVPAFHLLRHDLYRSYGWNGWISEHRAPFGVMFAGRGCSGKCNFCAAHSVFGRRMRYFPIDRIRAEIDLLVSKYNVRILNFMDDTFTANHALVHSICDYFIEMGYNHGVETMVSARVDTVDKPILEKMRKAGIRWICFGVESGDQRILDRMQKRITIEKIREAVGRANEAGLSVVGNYMIGHLGETWETAMATISLACELKQEYASFATVIPFPGTDLYQHCLNRQIELPSWNGFGNVNTPPIALNESLNSKSLMELRALAVNRFFKRPSYLVGLLRRFDSVTIIRDFTRMYLAIRKERKEGRF